MRLYEISSLTKDQFTPKHRANPKAVGQDFVQKDQEEIGHGMYAEVFSTVQEPGSVRKISTEPVRDLKEDAYFQYVSMIAKNDRMSSNPYFPRIFDIQVRSFDRKNFNNTITLGIEYVYAVDMERLLPFDSLSSEEGRMLGNKMFYDFEKLYRPHRVISGQNKIDYKYILFDYIDETFIGRGPYVDSDPLVTTIKDSRYKQALMLIKSMIAKSDRIKQDMHDENIMIRRGPGGPQVVITDPVQ